MNLKVHSHYLYFMDQQAFRLVHVAILLCDLGRDLKSMRFIKYFLSLNYKIDLLCGGRGGGLSLSPITNFTFFPFHWDNWLAEDISSTPTNNA